MKIRTYFTVLIVFVSYTVFSCVSTSSVEPSAASQTLNSQDPKLIPFRVSEDIKSKIKNSGVGDAPRLGRIIFSPEVHYEPHALTRRRTIFALATQNKAWALEEGTRFQPAKERKKSQIIGLEGGGVLELTGLVGLVDAIEGRTEIRDTDLRRWAMISFCLSIFYTSSPSMTDSELSELRGAFLINSDLQLIVNELSQWKSRHSSFEDQENYERFINSIQKYDEVFVRCLRQQCLSVPLRVMSKILLRNIHDDNNLRDFAAFIDST